MEIFRLSDDLINKLIVPAAFPITPRYHVLQTLQLLINILPSFLSIMHGSSYMIFYDIYRTLIRVIKEKKNVSLKSIIYIDILILFEVESDTLVSFSPHV